MTRLTMLLLVMLAALGLVTPAAAQQGGGGGNPPPGPGGNCGTGGYPPCNRDSTDVRNFGVFRAGEQFNKQDCGFDANATARLTFNGAEAGTRPVEGDGCLRMQVTIGEQRRVTFNNRTFTGQCGRNSIGVTAPSNGGTRTVTNMFEINCQGGVGGADLARPATLPRTGVAIAGMGGGALLLALVGTVLVVGARRRRQTS